MQTYLAFVSSNIFETINPFWTAVDRGLIKPQKVVLLSIPEYKKEVQSISKWFSTISERYLGSEHNLIVENHTFDDENIPVFIEIIKDLITKEVEAKREVVLDTTSAEWNYIPATIMLMADENRDLIKTVFYQQFSSPEYSQIPYPLIPNPEHRLYNLLKIQALEDLSI
ncbi:MAG: hypothetical protein N3A62_09060 [Thermodesulfovibrionales bacterium]|nr:hypothetical protein [Thermodesulfovibrionales bacterium]